eukprot:COSAG01_NODE_3143_length_6519_cov_61.635358_8_plen_134_part_00
MDAIADMKYSHLPIGGSWKWTKEALVAREMIAAINHARAKGKHILFHCHTGYRTGAFPTLLLGVISDTASKDMTARLEGGGPFGQQEHTRPLSTVQNRIYLRAACSTDSQQEQNILIVNRNRTQSNQDTQTLY